MPLTKQSQYRFHEFEVDLAHRSLRRAGHPVTVDSQTFDLLAFLVNNPQRVVTEDELTEALWPDSETGESSLSDHIRLLREALAGAKPGDKLLVTIPGYGYQFIPSVAEIPEAVADRRAAAADVPVPGGHANFHEVLKSADQSSGTSTNQSTDQSTDRAGKSAAHPPDPHSVLLVEEGTDRSLDEDADERPASGGSSRASRDSGSWRLAVFAAIVAILSIGGVFAWRWMHQPRRESLSLVIADFDNSTGNPQFDGALKTAFTIDMEQSPFLTVASRDQIAGQPPNPAADPGQSSLPRFTPELAREACRRIGDQAYLTGSVRSLGQRFLVTIRVFGCAGGANLATSRGIADSPGAVVTVLDKVAVDLRKQLGEPAQSVAGFSKPFFADRSANLDALKSYSDARRLRFEGKLEESLTQLQHAVEIDPQFTLAFAELGAVYAELNQPDQANAAMTRAFQLRDSADEPHRLQIVATYNDLITGDILASIHNYKDWSIEYPRNPAPLVNLAEREIQVGKPGMALDPAQRALKLNPSNPATYVVLARAQLSVGQVDQAGNICQSAIGRHLDGEQIHAFLMEIAFLRLDQAAVDAQIAWAKGKPAEPYMLLQQGLMDFAAGKAKAAEEIFANAVDAYRKQGQVEKVNRALSAMPRIEADLGLEEIAYALLTRMPEINGSTDIPVAWAATGETSRAQALLQRELDAHPTNTLWQEDFAPQIKAAIALEQKRPEEAIDDLKPALPFDLRGFDVPAMRGRAYLAARQPELAEAEFHKIIDNLGIEPLSYNYPLARLGLARALAQEGKTSDAGFAYSLVLRIWKDADPDLPRLKEAKAEYARLTGGAAVKPSPAAGPRASRKPSASRR
jgi:DNA-binding winged helix-turn-helix (wHTH) protein/tetratricopeptide (TPR) repeat protein